MKKALISFAAVAALAIPAFAGLQMGDVLYNPDLTGTGEIGDGGPYYTSGLPSWLNDNSLKSSLVSPIQGIPGFSQFEGTVESAVHFINGVDASGGLGFSYRINLAGNSAPNLVRASLAAQGWLGVNIFDAGADNSGNTSAATGNTTWTDGDPYFIERDAIAGNPQWTFRLGQDGTTINPNQSSALVWLETDAEIWRESSISLLDGGAAGAARVLTVAIPSPAAAGLGLFGVALAGAFRRRIG
jgi:hypothetical protein